MAEEERAPAREEHEEHEEQRMFLQMGPSHPAMHGTIRIRLELDGERVVASDVDIGYLHRAMEKHSETVAWNQVFPYTDRLNYVSPLINNFGYAGAVEKLLGIEPPPRCQWIRTLMSEVSRVADHLTSVGAGAMELGAFTAFLYFMKAREYWYELIENVTGARVMSTYARVGGLHADLPRGFGRKVREGVRKTRSVLDEIDGLLTRNRIFVDRLSGVGKISLERAKAHGWTGPLLRGCGLPYDVRKAQPYFAYDQVAFEVPCRTEGDNYSRYVVRMAEMEQSMRIIEQCLEKMPAGDINVGPDGLPVDLDALKCVEPSDLVDLAKRGDTELLQNVHLHVSPNLLGTEPGRLLQVSTDRRDVTLPPKEQTYRSIEGMMNHFKLIMLDHGIRPPVGEAYFPVEGANGELGFYVVSDGSDHAYRVRVRPPCFPLMSALSGLIQGEMVADIVATFGTINMIGGELDR